MRDERVHVCRQLVHPHVGIHGLFPLLEAIDPGAGDPGPSVSQPLQATLARLGTAARDDAGLRTLPAAHLAATRHFADIVRAGQLVPQRCKRFGDDRLYLHYGTLAYRPSGLSSNNAVDLPIGFIFGPSVSSQSNWTYPFDTGAALCGMFHGFCDNLTEVAKYATCGETAPNALVRHLYEDNRRYLRGELSGSAAALPAPIPDLAKFLGSDLTPSVDHRQRAIELHYCDPIPLSSLLWVGLPRCQLDEFARLIRAVGVVPQYWTYESTQVFTPESIAAILEEKAKEEVIRRFLDAP